MTLPATFVIDTPGDAARAAELRRVKLLATGVLAATFAIFIGARALLPMHPAFGFIAAFAEAATIGGLADWYAVVALFKRPLGLPIPHTAIIQSNQQRIADKLGEFIEVHFLESALPLPPWSVSGSPVIRTLPPYPSPRCGSERLSQPFRRPTSCAAWAGAWASRSAF
jgi:hypothetical protein